MRNSLLLGAALAVLIPQIACAADAPPATDADGHPKDDHTITVTASPFATSIDNTASITAHVDAETALRNGGSSIADSLADVPGISSTGFASGASRPIIRGMDATRVRILEDGVSSSDVSDIGPDHGVPIDPLSARSIEVVRGAATLRYGSQAIGGVVNAINDRVPTKLPDKTFSGEMTGSFDSVSNTGEGSALADVKVGNFALHADGFYRHADDYDTPLGTQANSFFHGHGESIGGTYFFGNSHIGGAIVQYNADYGIPSDTTYIDMKQTKGIVRGSFDLGNPIAQTLNVDVSYANYQHTENEPDGTVDSTFKNKEWDVRAEMLMGRMGPLYHTAVGFQFMHRDFSALGADSDYLFPTTTESEAGFLFTELPVTSNFKLQGSGRVEHVAITGTPSTDIFTTREFTPVSGAISAIYDPTGTVKLGFTFSSTGRAPAITELFARGGHDGPNTFETGDPTLKIERANSIELTGRYHGKRFKFEGSLYSTWFSNYVYGDLTGRTCDGEGVCTDAPDGDLRELNYTQKSAHFRGAEAQASYKLVKTHEGGLELKLQGDYVRATLSDGINVPRIPAGKLGGGIGWTSDLFDAGLTYTHVFTQKDFGIFEDQTPGYDLLNAQIAVRPFKSAPGVEFALVAKNLTNSVERDAAALNRDLVVMPGRNIRFVVKVATF